MHFVFHQHSELRKDKRLVHLECCRRPNKIPRIRTFSLVQQRQQVSLETFGFKMLPRRNFCIFTPSTNTHEAFMREILGKARNICQFIPLFPDPTLDCDLSVACVLNYADQAVRPSRLIPVFSDEEAPAKPREEAHECLHGFLPDAEAGNHSEKPRLAQRGDLQGEFSSSLANTPCLTKSYISKVDLHKFNLRDFLVETNNFPQNLGKAWKLLGDAEKSKYQEEAETLRLLHQKEYPDYKYRPKKRTRSGSDTGGMRVKQEKEEGGLSKRMHREENQIMDADFQFKREPQTFASISTSPDSPRYTFPSNQAFRYVFQQEKYLQNQFIETSNANQRRENIKFALSARQSMECMT